MSSSNLPKQLDAVLWEHQRKAINFALDRLPIMCNCSFMSLWIPRRDSGIDHMTCWACGSSIRLLGLEGDGGYVFGKVNGKTKLFDVQASKALPSWRLPDTERDEIIRKFEESGTKEQL